MYFFHFSSCKPYQCNYEVRWKGCGSFCCDSGFIKAFISNFSWKYEIIHPVYHTLYASHVKEPSSHRPLPFKLYLQHLALSGQEEERKGGVRARLRRRPFKPPLPSIVMGNARSLNNKIDELAANTRYLSAYREAGIVCITETWLHDTHPDSCFEPDGFKIYRGDRTKDSGKNTGGGVCALINNKWCSPNNIHITHKSCTPDLALA